MGCVQFSNRTPIPEVATDRPRRRRRLQLSFYDTGYLPSSDSDASTPPTKEEKNIFDTIEEVFPEKRNAIECYFCFENTGLLLTMPRCRCRQFAHKKCLMKYVSQKNLSCSICKELYCDIISEENKIEMVQRILTVIKDRELLFQHKTFINSIISVT